MPSISSSHDGARLYYRDYLPPSSSSSSRPPAIPLIFTSAWPFASVMWDHLVLPLLSHNHRCILPDRRGYGKSEFSNPAPDSTTDTINYDILAQDLTQIISTALPASSPFIAIGSSLGCHEWILAFKQDPSLLSRCVGVIFIGCSLPIPLRTPLKPSGPPRSFWDDLLRDLRADRFTQLRTVVDFVFRPDLGNVLSEGEKTRYLRMAEEADPVAVERTVDIILSRDLTEDLMEVGPKMEMRVLILQGERDEVNPVSEGLELVRECVKGKVEILVYETGAHGLYQTHKERCLEDMLTFTEGCAEKSGSE